MSKPKSDAERLMDEQMKHVEGLGDIPVFDVRKPVEQTLQEIADNWQRVEDDRVAQYREERADLSEEDEAGLRLIIRTEIMRLAMGEKRSK